MKYCIIRHYPKDSIAKNSNIVYYTFTVLEHIAKVNKHTLVDVKSIDSDTIILMSITTLDGVPYLKKIRETYPNNTIISGGHFAFNFPVLLLFSDYVNVGQGFEFFKCQTLDEIKKLPCIATKKDPDKIIIPSELIEWEIVPLAKDSGNHYYWGGVGCQNKCQYCATSWTNRHQENSKNRILGACEYCKKIGKSITITSNEYDYSSGAQVQDIMLKEYIKTPFSKKGNPRLIRLGIEFPSEETRRHTGKFFTNDQFYEAIEKAQRENKELNLFFIAGLDPLEAFSELLFKYPHKTRTPKAFVKITNLVYHQYTPIFKKRFNININNYAYPEFQKNLLRKNGLTQRYRYLTIAYPRKAFYETAIGCVTTLKEYEIARKIHNAKNDTEAFSLLVNSGLLENDFSPRIKFWYQKEKPLNIKP